MKTSAIALELVRKLFEEFHLEPGDLIFMGTPGRTRSLSHGDVVEVPLGGVGTLSNRIIWPDQ